MLARALSPTQYNNRRPQKKNLELDKSRIRPGSTRDLLFSLKKCFTFFSLSLSLSLAMPLSLCSFVFFFKTATTTATMAAFWDSDEKPAFRYDTDAKFKEEEEEKKDERKRIFLKKGHSQNQCHQNNCTFSCYVNYNVCCVLPPARLCFRFGCGRRDKEA